jgi:DNA polymerase-3 subunit epsilon
MKERIRRIRYELTGSELIALLLESEMIKKHQPPFNRDQRNTMYLYGIFCAADANNYLCLSLERLKNGDQPLLSFTNKMEAMEFLDKLVSQYSLCQKMCGIHKTGGCCFYYHMKRCRGACAGKESPEAYNRRVEQAIRQFDYAFSSFLIIGKGRNENEKSVVAVENGVFKGFGYFEPEFAGDSVEQIKTAVQSKDGNQDARRIIIRYLRQNNGDVVK